MGLRVSKQPPPDPCAGKSRFIQSIRSVVQNKMCNAAHMVETAAGKSFTKKYTTYRFKDVTGKPLPFVITDVMGLENDKDRGAQPEDIISALKGHIKEEYMFHPDRPCPEESFNRNPTLNDKVHCLVFVIPANLIATCNDDSDANQKTDISDENLMQKMKHIRRKACDLKIPQVVILTKVDLACPHVEKDIRDIYKSKLIHRKAKECSNALGIPMSDIFLVRNYDEEKQLKPDVDAVLLFTLTQILDFAKEFVEATKHPESARDHLYPPLIDLAVGENANNMAVL